MISLTAEQAFSAYEAVRHRLPTASPPERASRRVTSLEDLAEDFDVFLLDAFGVLNIGETAIPGTRERIDDLRRAGKRVLVVSNAASVPRDDLATKYRRLGYDFEPEDIISSRLAMAAAMTGTESVYWGVMSSSSVHLGDFGDIRAVALQDDPGPYEDAEGFLLIGSGSWTEARQARLEAAIRAKHRPVLVANPDIVAPRENGFSAEPGHFAHLLADRTGVVPEFFGKPFGNIFELALSRAGDIPKRRTLMVGDSLHTDILGAQAAGVASALVADYGFFAGSDAQSAIERSKIVPDFILDRP